MLEEGLQSGLGRQARREHEAYNALEEAEKAYNREQLTIQNSIIQHLMLSPDEQHLLAFTDRGHLLIWAVANYIATSKEQGPVPPVDAPAQGAYPVPTPETLGPHECRSLPLDEQLHGAPCLTVNVCSPCHPTPAVASRKPGRRALNSAIFVDAARKGHDLVVAGDGAIFVLTWAGVQAELSKDPGQWSAPLPPPLQLRALPDLPTYEHCVESHSVCLAPSGRSRSKSRVVYSGCGDAVLRGWDLDKQQPLFAVAGVHMDAIRAVRVAGQRTLLSMQESGFLVVWECSSDPAQPPEPRGKVDLMQGLPAEIHNKMGEAIGGRSRVWWSACMDVDEQGGWAACGGGAEFGGVHTLYKFGYVALVSLADPAKPVVVMSAATNKLDEPGAEGSGRRKEGRPGPVVHDVRFYDCETIITAGRDRKVTHWWRSTLKKRKEARCRLFCINSVCVRRQPPGQGVLFLGGEGPWVDVFLQPENVSARRPVMR